MDDQAVAPVAPAGLARRAAVTAGAVGLVLALQRVPLPFLDHRALEALLGGPMGPRLSILALGLRPLVSAFLLVEVVALAVPGLRALRHGPPAARGRLTRAAWVLGACLAVGQGWGVALILTGTRSGDLPWPVVPLALTLAAGALLAGLLAEQVSRHGLGNGFAVLVAVQVLQELVPLGALLHETRDLWSGERQLAAAALVVLLPLAAAPLLRGRRSQPGPRVPVPTSGLAVVAVPGAILALLGRLSASWPALAPLSGVLPRGDWAEAGLRVALTIPLAWLFSRLFCAPSAVLASHRRAAPGPLDEAAEQGVRRALRSAQLRSLALVLGTALVPVLLLGLGMPIAIGADVPLALAIVAAVALDVAEEWRARRRAELAPALALYRVHAVPPALEALAAQGIPAVARGRRFRALFHFFAPFAPIELLVAPEHAALAAPCCTGGVAEPAPRAPSMAG